MKIHIKYVICETATQKECTDAKRRRTKFETNK